MGSSHEEWRERLLAACDRTLHHLHDRNDPAVVMLTADVRALRDRLERELDANRGPSRASGTAASVPPRRRESE